MALGERELAREQAAFRAAAERLAPGQDPQVTWLAVRRDHPPLGGVVGAAERITDSLTHFVRSHGIATIPAGERVVVKPASPFDLGFASMHARPPLEKASVKSVFYITDAPAGLPVEQQSEWLERYNYASLSNTAAHEAVPGHWLHSIYMRRTPGKVRRIWIGLNPFPQPSSGQDGWAHYAEQMVLDEGFGAGDPRLGAGVQPARVPRARDAQRHRADLGAPPADAPGPLGCRDPLTCFPAPTPAGSPRRPQG